MGIVVCLLFLIPDYVEWDDSILYTEGRKTIAERQISSNLPLNLDE